MLQPMHIQIIRPAFCPVLALIVSVLAALPVRAQTPSPVASPFPESWVSDQTDTLSDLQKNLIDDLCRDIQTQYNRQLAVAVIGSTKGRDHRRYATELFNRWRVGDGYKNQGVLVFAAMDDRAAEIVLGVGIDSRASRDAAQSVMDDVMLPKFKANDAGAAIYEGVHACAKQIIGVGKLAVADKLPNIPAEQPVVTAEMPLDASQEFGDEMNVLSSAGQTDNDDATNSTGSSTNAQGSGANTPGSRDGSTPEALSTPLADMDLFQPVAIPAPTAPTAGTRPPVGDRVRPRRRPKPSYLPWVLGLGGAGVLATFFGARHYLRYRRRSCETCRLDRVLLTEIQDDDFLNHPERIEEKIGSVDYDVWACLECEDVLKLRYGRWLTRYSKCPECSYVTRFKITETVIRATTINGGVVRVKEFCKNCDYQHTYTYATPRIQKRSSGSSSGGFSGGGGSSSGGFSSGGGASGRW